mgnify:CR=1 FL=1
MSTILSLAPQNVWKHFYSLTQIPRPSGHMEKITAFLLGFGKELGLESFVDEAGNVIIRKPATPGMENRKGVILQAHMDMVPQKNNDTVHDFEKDPIETYIDGDWVKAKGTTLGADNGLGVAAIMAGGGRVGSKRPETRSFGSSYHERRRNRYVWCIRLETGYTERRDSFESGFGR